jgi:hypothetical protein
MLLNPHRKWPNISILKIKEKLSIGNWNSFLNTCYKYQDIESLKKALYGIQADMSDLVKIGANSTDIVNLFLRLQTSLINTARKVLKIKYPSPLDNAGNDMAVEERLAQKNNRNSLSKIEKAKLDFSRHSAIKKKRDQEFELFIKESSF